MDAIPNPKVSYYQHLTEDITPWLQLIGTKVFICSKLGH
jgi:hypothetical protein